MINKSKVYGYYGGVRTENVYTPPPSVPFVPQTPQTAFTAQARNNFNIVARGAAIYAANASSLLQRTAVTQGANQTFTISTPGIPNTITYNNPTTNTAGINLNSPNGGNY